MISLLETILSIKNDAQVSCENEDINKLVWHDENPTNITNEEILAKQTELQTAYDNDYARKRKEEYPTVEELVVALYDTDDKADIETKRAAVKAKYPKPA